MSARSFERALTLGLLLGLASLHAACKEQPKEAMASPSPSATATPSARPMSLSAALPSPTPRPVRPSMPAELAGAFVFYEDFEHGLDKWTTSGDNGAVGWHLLKAATCGGLFTMVLGTEKNGPFQEGAPGALLSLVKPIRLDKARHPQLQYDLKGLVAPPELITVRPEIRRAGGSWTPVGALAEARYPLVVTFTADLTPYVGGPTELRFRGTVKPGARVHKGLFLDDVQIVEPNHR